MWNIGKLDKSRQIVSFTNDLFDFPYTSQWGSRWKRVISGTRAVKQLLEQCILGRLYCPGYHASRNNYTISRCSWDAINLSSLEYRSIQITLLLLPANESIVHVSEPDSKKSELGYKWRHSVTTIDDLRLPNLLQLNSQRGVWEMWCKLFRKLKHL